MVVPRVPGWRAGRNNRGVPPSTRNRRHTAYWRATLRLALWLLGLWLAVTVGVALLGPRTDWPFFGWPFGVWATAQGALVVYCGIVWAYALVMDRLDREHADDAD